MFHVVGSTPEAPTLDEATHGTSAPTEEVTLAELRAARDAADERRRRSRWRRSLSARRTHRSRSSSATRRCSAGGSVDAADRVPRFHRPRRPGSGRGARDRRPAPGGRRRAARRHVQLHRADPAARRRSGDDRLGEVGLLRPGQHRRGGRLRLDRGVHRVRASPGRVVRDDGPWGGRVSRRRSRRWCSTEGLSLWGGMDPATGEVIDAHHPQRGANLAGRVARHAVRPWIVLERLGAGGGRPGRHRPGGDPAAEPDLILSIGAAVAEELYGVDVPVVVLRPGRARRDPRRGGGPHRSGRRERRLIAATLRPWTSGHRSRPRTPRSRRSCATRRRGPARISS